MINHVTTGKAEPVHSQAVIYVHISGLPACWITTDIELGYLEIGLVTIDHARLHISFISASHTCTFGRGVFTTSGGPVTLSGGAVRCSQLWTLASI